MRAGCGLPPSIQTSTRAVASSGKRTQPWTWHERVASRAPSTGRSSAPRGAARSRSRKARRRDTLVPAVEVVEPDDPPIAELVYERVLPVDLDAAPTPGGPHAHNRHHPVPGVDELRRLEAPLCPRLAPVGKPAAEPVMPAVVARVWDVVILDHRLLVEHFPEDLALCEALERFTHQRHVVLGHGASIAAPHA